MSTTEATEATEPATSIWAPAMIVAVAALIIYVFVAAIFDAREDHKYVQQQQTYVQQCRAHCGFRTALLVNGGEGCLCLDPRNVEGKDILPYATQVGPAQATTP